MILKPTLGRVSTDSQVHQGSAEGFGLSVFRGRVGGVMPDAEIFGWLLADEASALNHNFWLVVQLEVEFAVLSQARTDAVGLTIGWCGEGDFAVVVGSAANR